MTTSEKTVPYELTRTRFSWPPHVTRELSSGATPVRATRAAVRFVSFEPLIGSVVGADLTDIHWAIVGGESGPRARAMDEENTNTPDLLQAAAEVFIQIWNRTKGIRAPIKGVEFIPTNIRVARFGDPSWVKNYPDALAKFPLAYFGKAGTPATLFWDEDKIYEILAGKYDSSPKSNNGKTVNS